MFQEGLYLLRKNEFIQNNQYIYKFGRSKNILNRMDNYSNGSMIHLLISCDDTNIHEKKILELFRNKYTIQLYYGSEYFLGNVKTMKEDIISYVSNIMQEKGYQLINNNVLIERFDKETNKKIPKYEQELHNLQITSIPPKIIINNNINQMEHQTGIQKTTEININNTNNKNSDIKTLFKCNCGFNAKSQKQLTKHINKCSNKNDNSDLTCKKCKHIYTTKSNRDRHIKNCNFGEQPANDEDFINSNDYFISEISKIEKDFQIIKSFHTMYKLSNASEKQKLIHMSCYVTYKNLINKYKNIINNINID